ncbi:MAG: hypothetical protein ACJARD_001477 [Alphaproteobacteria bacterium]|jgi:hypothetical protein
MRNKPFLSAVISLITTSGTLICCALPALFVTFGAGVVLAGLVSDFPWLISLSKHKEIIFLAAALALIVAGIMQYRAKFMPCPIDKNQAFTCMRIRKISLYVYIFSVIVFCFGLFFSFIAQHLI